MLRMTLKLFSCLLAATSIDLSAKKAKHEVVETKTVRGIEIQKVKKRPCALQSCSEVTQATDGFEL